MITLLGMLIMRKSVFLAKDVEKSADVSILKEKQFETCFLKTIVWLPNCGICVGVR